MGDTNIMNAEQLRLEAQNEGREDWRHWGPYLAERAWGTVREDYSAGGAAWEYFDHDQSRSRAYRWNEDGLGGICDEAQNLCFSLALWNGVDPILKERAFGLTGNQGNHGEDVKEYYFYTDATPSHSFMRYLYKYPQAAYPYQSLVEVNKSRSRQDPPFNLLDTGVFEQSRYWDVEVRYAKASTDEIHMRIIASNRGDETKTLHLLPTLLFRNTWSWGDIPTKPKFTAAKAPKGAQWAVKAKHESLGEYHLYGRQKAQTLYTENETNNEKLWSAANASAYVKDAFHRYVINDEKKAVNAGQIGTKFSAWHEVTVQAGQSTTIELVLTKGTITAPFEQSEAIFTMREKEADLFYDALLPKSDFQDKNILRQSMAGMIWSKQFFHFDVARWLDGDGLEPPDGHKFGRNRAWRHLKAAHVISMPDAWEYPWFAAWDLAFHCAAIALVDVDFAKQQIELLLKENFLHPNGQIPAYEWAFGDVNPPVLAAAALKVFRAERVQRGKGDLNFLGRIVHKLLMNYTWWLNAKDTDGNNVFEGGFLGLDNISVYDRSQPLPAGYSLKQADATGWVAMFSLNMTVMALELTAENGDYEDVAIQCYSQFLGVANTIAGHVSKNTHSGLSLWDDDAGFFKDLVVKPDGSSQRIDVFSLVGLIPMFACEVVDKRLLKNAPRFTEVLNSHAGGLFDGHTICACPASVNDRGEHLLSLVDHTMLPHIMRRLLSEDEFLSDYGIRSVSKIHATNRDLGHIDGIGQALIEYVPGESNSGLFGGNSNWRGPIWMPTNYTLIQAIEKFHRYLGDDYIVAVPCLDNKELNLLEISRLISNRIVGIFRRDEAGRLPALPADSPFQHDSHWKDLLLFHEYFHGDTGLGLGAMHQTGWTGLVANLVKRKYHTGIPAFWLNDTKETANAKASSTTIVSTKMIAANGCSQPNKCGQK
ncbi:MAG: glucosidase [Proteobacteria bacterium ST_bin12]|nr:MAG: glucosidase [Proteobacteria bacterium ST_bin12]